MDKSDKEWIDNATYKELLCKWRFAPAGSPWFQGDLGVYFAKVMAEKKAQDPGGAVRASKNVEW